MSARLSVAPKNSEWVEEEVTQTCLVPSEIRHADSGVWKVPPRAPANDITPDRRETYALFAPLVRRIALKAIRTLPRSILIDDIVSAGWVGMSEAIKRRPADMPDDQFEAYASYRIRGAILDYLRALDPLSRRLRGLARDLHAATRSLSHRLGRPPTQEELATEMKIPLAQLQKATTDIQESGMDRVDATATFDAPSAEPSPELLAERHQMVKAVQVLIKSLPERLQVVLGLHYEHECSLREIGEILGVTESRVCQLHAEAVGRIRAQLEGRKGTVRRRALPSHTV